MQTMIEDFITFYQSLSEPKNTEVLDLNEIITTIEGELKETINNKNARISVEKLPTIRGIKPHIKQMLKHLISNALKFSKKNEPPQIIINSSIENTKGNKAHLKLSIQDNGIGFDQKYSERIFELFQRLHSNDEYSGSGIGLSLCKKIAEDHQGWIIMVSECGKDSIFSVYLGR